MLEILSWEFAGRGRPKKNEEDEEIPET